MRRARTRHTATLSVSLSPLPSALYHHHHHPAAPPPTPVPPPGRGARLSPGDAPLWPVLARRRPPGTRAGGHIWQRDTNGSTPGHVDTRHDSHATRSLSHTSHITHHTFIGDPLSSLRAALCLTHLSISLTGLTHQPSCLASLCSRDGAAAALAHCTSRTLSALFSLIATLCAFYSRAPGSRL